MPRRAVEYRGTTLEEMDLPAILQRAPELCLIDELAHTNAPGRRAREALRGHRGRADAGIDVFSTVNVQHLESLNDRVAELTGVRVRETFPDKVLGARRRGRARRPHARGADRRACGPEGVPAGARAAALNSFFRSRTWPRCARSRCARSRRTSRPSGSCATRCRSARSGSSARRRRPIAERLLALVTPDAALAAARAPRVALGPAPWRRARPALVREPRAEPPASEREQLEALRRLASVLGAHLLVEEGDDVVESAARVAASAGRPTC